MDITGFALVTGAGSGIGKAAALAYAEEGAAGILCADLILKAAEDVVAEATKVAVHKDFKAIAVQVDVTKNTSVVDMMLKMKETFGRCDYAVNCAGIGVQKDAEIAEADGPEFTRFLDVNVNGMFLATRGQSAMMKTQEPKVVSSRNPKRGAQRGVIINMASAASYMCSPRMVQYTTSKYAVLGLSRSAALDNAAHGIRVNALCPSWVDTPMVQKAIEGVPELKDHIERSVPMGRIAEVDEIADTIMFLSSPRASYVTGAGFIVDGGTTLMTKV